MLKKKERKRTLWLWVSSRTSLKPEPNYHVSSLVPLIDIHCPPMCMITYDYLFKILRMYQQTTHTHQLKAKKSIKLYLKSTGFSWCFFKLCFNFWISDFILSCSYKIYVKLLSPWNVLCGATCISFTIPLLFICGSRLNCLLMMR